MKPYTTWAPAALKVARAQRILAILVKACLEFDQRRDRLAGASAASTRVRTIGLSLREVR